MTTRFPWLITSGRAALLMCVYYIANADAQTSQPQLTRNAAFEYDLSTGLLIREVIEPWNSDLCLVTQYAYDLYGNKKSGTTRNCNGIPFNYSIPFDDGQPPVEAPAPNCQPTTPPSPPASTACFTTRTINTSFGATGPIVVTNALQQQETRYFDGRFMTMTSLTGPNQLQTQWTYDRFGRKTLESRADGTKTNWFYERCADLAAGSCPPPPTGQTVQYRVRVTASGAPDTSTYYDSLNRPVRTETQGFDGRPVRKDTRYDSLGRVAAVSQPFTDETTQVFTTFTYDPLGRVIAADDPTVNGVTKRTSTTYTGLVTTVKVGSSAGSGTTDVTGTAMPGGVPQVRVTTKNSQGQVISVTQQ
jgi:YD repeat-containing protein